MQTSLDSRREFQTDSGSVLREEADGSIGGTSIHELVVRPGGVVQIDGGQLEIRVSPSGALEVLQRALLPVKPERIGDEPVAGPNEADSDLDSRPQSAEHLPARTKLYSSAEVARNFFNKSTQWFHYGAGSTGRKDADADPLFVYPDGTPIEGVLIGKRKRRYTLAHIEAIAECWYRRGNLTEEELQAVLDKVRAARVD